MNTIDARSMFPRRNVYGVAWAMRTKTEKRLIQPLFYIVVCVAGFRLF